MKKILVLGAGRVSAPLVAYLLDNGYRVTCASLVFGSVKRLLDNNENGIAVKLDVDDAENLNKLVADNDLTVSLLPFTLHPRIARLCIKHRKHMVTASYVSPEMRSLDSAATSAGILLLNEIGVDPGLDHMSAMRYRQRSKARRKSA